MFNYNQTQKIKDTATEKGLELWEQINCENPDYSGFIEIQMQGGLNAQSNYDPCYNPNYLDDVIYALLLDNLLPWLNKHFGEIENPILSKYDGKLLSEIPDHLAYAMSIFVPTLADKLIQQAITQYFDNPQALTDDICEGINTNF